MKWRMAVVATAMGAWWLIMPAHSQGPKIIPPTSLEYYRDGKQPAAGFYRDLAINGAKQAIRDDAANVEITSMQLTTGFYGYPHACGYVTPRYDRKQRQRFIFMVSTRHTSLFASLKQKQLVDAMALCGFLPRSPSPHE